MELELNKVSFIDEFRKVRNIENRKAKDRTEGFLYIHNCTTKALADGHEFKVGDLDFSKFTYNDLQDYIEYYNDNLEPKISSVSLLFKILHEAESVFVKERKFY